MLDSDRYKKKLEFHYVGQKPEDIKTENIIFHDPLSGKELAEELNKNDIYVTGSVNEPAGMHHIEGALCGLPLLYRESGALPEYCEGFGVSFNSIDDFEEKLDKLVKNYNKYAEKIRSYNNNSDRMCKEYLNLFNNLVRNRDEIVKLRDGKIYNPSFKTSFFIRYYYYYFLNKFLHFC
jgi:glycosyltransferase involved in cell wall biosynthesis